MLSDLNRTFPDNISFRKTSSPCWQKALFNVLRAYGHHNPSVGYCQVLQILLSGTFICASFLVDVFDFL